MRSWLPDAIGGIHWWGVDDASSTVYAPLYCSMTESPDLMRKGFGGIMDFEENAAHWVFNQVTNFAYTRYNIIHPEIAERQANIEKSYITQTAAIDKVAAALYEQDKKLAVNFLTNYSVNTANELVKDWKEFYQYLFMKYVDGNVKEKTDIPDNYKYYNPKIEYPGYSKDWLKRIVDETGTQFKVIETKKD
jgi:dipeptidase